MNADIYPDPKRMRPVFRLVIEYFKKMPQYISLYLILYAQKIPGPAFLALYCTWIFILCGAE